MNTIGDAVRFVRQSQGWEQKDLAQKAELSPSQISCIEKGSRDPSWDSLKRICNALGVSVSMVVMLVEKEHPTIKPMMPLVYSHLFERSVSGSNP